MNVKLWKRKGEVLQTLISLDAGVKSLSFNPDGQVLASSDSLGKVTLWNLDFDSSPEKLLAQACNCVRDLMNEFGLKPGIDYEDELRDNEPASDFVIKSKEANDLIQDLLNGRIVVRKEHTKISKHGNQYTVKAHFVNVSGK